MFRLIFKKLFYLVYCWRCLKKEKVIKLLVTNFSFFKALYFLGFKNSGLIFNKFMGWIYVPFLPKYLLDFMEAYELYSIKNTLKLKKIYLLATSSSSLLPLLWSRRGSRHNLYGTIYLDHKLNFSGQHILCIPTWCSAKGTLSDTQKALNTLWVTSSAALGEATLRHFPCWSLLTLLLILLTLNLFRANKCTLKRKK